MDAAAKRQHGLGGKLDPEGRVNYSCALPDSLHPGLLLSSAEPDASEEYVPEGNRGLSHVRKELPKECGATFRCWQMQGAGNQR